MPRKNAQESGNTPNTFAPPSSRRHYNSSTGYVGHRKGRLSKKNAAEKWTPGTSAKRRKERPPQKTCNVRAETSIVQSGVAAAAAAAAGAVDETLRKSGGDLRGARLGGRFFAVLLALVLLLRLELAGLCLLLERLDTRGLPLLLVDSLHQNALVLELVTLASQVAAECQNETKQHRRSTSGPPADQPNTQGGGRDAC